MDMSQFIGTAEGRNSFATDVASNAERRMTASRGNIVVTFDYGYEKRVWTFDGNGFTVIEEKQVDGETEMAWLMPMQNVEKDYCVHNTTAYRYEISEDPCGDVWLWIIKNGVNVFDDVFSNTRDAKEYANNTIETMLCDDMMHT